MGGTDYYVNEPIDFTPSSKNLGINLYSGPQGSLAGSLPTWIAPYSRGIAYQKGHIVYYDARRWKDANGTLQTDVQALVDGSVLDSSVPLMWPFEYSELNLYVKITDNSNFDPGQGNAPVSGEGWYTFHALATAGWNTGFEATTVGGIFSLRHDDIVLNLADVHAEKKGGVGLVSADISETVKYVKCRATLKPTGSITANEIALIPSDRISIAGGTLRSPIDVPTTGGNIKIISGDYPSCLVPTVMFKGNDDNQGLDDISYEDWELKPAAEQLKYEEYQFNEYHLIAPGLEKLKSPTFSPQYAEARTSLRAYLSSSYVFATPFASSNSVPAWEAGKNYVIGESVAYAFNMVDIPKTDALRENKDVIWICILDHASSSSIKPPVATILSNGNVSGQESYWDNTYWRPYGLILNSPNSSIGDLWDSYKKQGELGVGSSGLSQTGLDGVSTDSLRKRMSDMIGGSRLYGHLTIGPSMFGRRAKTSGTQRMWRRRIRYTYGILPPGSGKPGEAEEKGARADLWLFPNTLKKDHAGQIRYAVQFGDVTSFSAVRIPGGKRSFFERFMFGFWGRRRYKSGWSTMPKARKDPSDYVLLLSGMVGQDSPIERTRSRLSTTYGWLSTSSTTAGIGYLNIDGPDGETVDNATTGSSDSSEPDYQEIDIIRFQFTKLKPFHVETGVTTVEGTYNIIIQDLNSGDMASTSFAYEEIMKRPSDTRLDSYNNTFKSGVGRDNNYNQSETNNALYRSEAAKIASIDDNSQLAVGSDVKLIGTRNYFNYVLLGHDAPGASAGPDRSTHKGLLIWSMDLTENQFERVAGLVQTGFRGIDIGDAAAQGGLKADDKMEHVVDLPDSVNNSNEFIVGDDINRASADFINHMTTDRPDWNANQYYDAGTVVAVVHLINTPGTIITQAHYDTLTPALQGQYRIDYYYALKCHTSGGSFSL